MNSKTGTFVANSVIFFGQKCIKLLVWMVLRGYWYFYGDIIFLLQLYAMLSLYPSLALRIFYNIGSPSWKHSYWRTFMGRERERFATIFFSFILIADVPSEQSVFVMLNGEESELRFLNIANPKVRDRPEKSHYARKSYYSSCACTCENWK